MRAVPPYPTPPPRREDVEHRLAPAVNSHHERLERLMALCTPVAGEPAAQPGGWLTWWTPAPAPSPEQRMRAAWRRVVVLRDRASLAEVERETLRTEVQALQSWREGLVRGLALAEATPDHGDDARAFEGALAVVDGVLTSITAPEPLLERLILALASLTAEHESQAVQAEGDLRGGARPSVSDDVQVLALDDVVVRLRACAVDRHELERSLVDRLPIAAGSPGAAWERATDELVQAEDPVRAWKDRRSS